MASTSAAAKATPAAAGGIEPGALVWIADAEVVWRPGKVLEPAKTDSALDLGPRLTVAFDISGEEEGSGGGDPFTVILPVQGIQAAAATLASNMARSASMPAERAAVRGRFASMPACVSEKESTTAVLRRNAVLLGDGALAVDDLTVVPELHEAAVLHAIDVRFAQGVIYTLTGPVLLAVNPFRILPGLYSQEALASYVGIEERRPHVFGVAGFAYHNICVQGKSQTVLVSGESGSGKTETTKFVMQFLALAGTESNSGDVRPPTPKGVSAMNKDTMLSRQVTPVSRAHSPREGSRSTSVESRGSRGVSGGRGKANAAPQRQSAEGSTALAGRMSHIERKVLGSNPLLEAFGNAKTLRNENSSRFGKYIELQFGAGTLQGLKPRLVGARIHTYLLEKVRVLYQQEGERNFHIFYQALAAARKQKWLQVPSTQVDSVTASFGNGSNARSTTSQLRSFTEEGGGLVDLGGFVGYSAASFAYLQRRADDGGADAADEFEDTLAAMRSVGLSISEASDTFRSLAAVLHLGNINFVEKRSETAEIDETTVDVLAIVSDLLGIVSLGVALCTRTIQAPEGMIRTANNARKATDARDALARHLYHAIFMFIVQRSNASIGHVEEATCCGVLDIFGFEVFHVNSFEQLCINYTNELLQQLFNNYIFENEAALYEDECIAWDPQSFPDNTAIVVLLHDKLKGILPMLEEECFSIGGSSEAWCKKLIKEHEQHLNFDHIKHKPGFFLVKHFAGPVMYTAEGFMEKNRDQLSADLVQCLQRSLRPFVRERFEEHGRSFGTKGLSDTKVAKAQRHSVSSDFRMQLQDLLVRIRATEPHFVRCIKPNSKSQAFATPEPGEEPGAKQRPFLQRPNVAEQLRYQGVLEAIRVARAGFPIRLLHADFVGDFRCLAAVDLRERCGRVAAAAAAAAARSAGARGAARGACAEDADADATAARVVREMLASPEFQQLLTSIGASIETGSYAIGSTRVFMKQEPFGILRSAMASRRSAAAVRLQANHRIRLARALRRRRLGAICRIQAGARGLHCRASLRVARWERAAVVAEAALRTLAARKRLREQRAAAVRLQSWARVAPARRVLCEALLSVTRLQRWRRSFVKRRRWRTLHERVFAIQRVWRGSLSRAWTRDHKADVHRCRLACRTLVRMRRRNIEHRAWRKDVLAKYRAAASPVAPTPPRFQIMSEILELHEQHRRKEQEIKGLGSEIADLSHRVQDLTGRACLRLRMCFSTDGSTACVGEACAVEGRARSRIGTGGSGV